MHNVRILLVMLAISLGATEALHAQGHATGRGNLIVSGSAGLSTFDGGELSGRQTAVHLFPHLQYFVSPGLALGGSVSIFHARSGDTSSTSWGVGPHASYFFGRGEQTLIPYVSAQGFYNGGSFAEWNYGAAAGAVYMLTSSVGLDASVFYRDPVAGIAVGITAFVF